MRTCSGRMASVPAASAIRFATPKKRATAALTGRSNSARFVVLDDAAFEHERDAVAELGGLGPVVGDDHGRDVSLALHSGWSHPSGYTFPPKRHNLPQ